MQRASIISLTRRCAPLAARLPRAMLLVILVAASSLAGPAPSAALRAGLSAANGPGPDEIVRVGLLFGASAPRSLVISGHGRFVAAQTSGAIDGDLRVEAREAGLAVIGKGGESRCGQWLEARPVESDSWLKLDGRAYRGRLRVELQPNGRLRVVNIVEVEDYLRGVVANEMFADPEAFKVQAVVSRTLALYVRDHGKRHEGQGFDLCTEGHCQVYRGADSETSLSNDAVSATRGEVIALHGQPILAAYHSNAGGATDEVGDVWPGSIEPDFAYLAAVSSPFDNAAARLDGYGWCYRWQKEIPLKEVAERLSDRGREVGAIRDLTVRSRSQSGRITDLEVIGTKSRTLVVGAARVREVLGTPSAKLDLQKTGASFVATGWGYGDGVGLSQHGALGMAWAGYRYDQILAHYYRGVELAQDYGRGSSRPLRETPAGRRSRVAERTP